MDVSKIQRVKGVNDVMPSAYFRKQSITLTLLEHFRLYGFLPIELPVLEHSDLYLRKSGEKIVLSMYDFVFRNRRLCLRPEMTASVIRAYIDNLTEEPLPIRLSYAGPVFRYEKPQRARYRQFTQVGVEIVGASGVISDGETIHLACSSLEKIGIKNYRLLLGHAGVLAEFLEGLGIDGQLRSFLTINMESVRKQQLPDLIKRISDAFPMLQSVPHGSEEFPQNPSDQARSPKLLALLKDLNEDEARQAVFDFLDALNITIDSSRDEVEIVDRLLAKIRREDQVPKINIAIQFMSKLSKLVGSPSNVLKEAETLLSSYGISRRPLQQLYDLVQVLGEYGIDQSKITLDLGLNRGLQYYTGVVFEIHHQALGAERQICGGGRYDDLCSTLGGPKTSATGFAFGLERLCIALEMEAALPSLDGMYPQFLVIPISEQDSNYALQIASQLRNNSIRTELGVRDRALKAHLQYAAKRKIPYVIIVGEQERNNQELVIRDMTHYTERRIGYADLSTKLIETELPDVETK